MRLGALLITSMILHTAAYAGTITLLTARDGLTDFLDWSEAGPVSSYVPDGATLTTHNGNQVTVNFAGAGSGQIVQQPGSFYGAFFPGDYLLFNTGNGPDTLTFARPISAIAFQVQNVHYGAYATEIIAYNGATRLGAFSVSADVGGNNDGTAAFLGVYDTTAEITSVVINGLDGAYFPQSFAINRLSLSEAGTAAPEPVSMAMTGAALGVIAVLRRRRATRAS